MELNLRVLQCHTLAHCRACRTDPDWTERNVGVREFLCPDGWTAQTIPERVATPPRSSAPVSLDQALTRVAICEQCPSYKGHTLTLKDRDVYKVKCKDCGCGGLSLIAGRCPLGKWPEAQAG